jgi:ubiquinone/menaquinone biosynthesis C-methylase UbiE
VSRVSGSDEWESEAENWLRWARNPCHDAYWYYRDAFFDEMVPPPGNRTLEIGCGEGRVARDLAARGHRVVAIDTSKTLLRHAQAAGGEVHHVLADGSAVPFPRASFDLVVTYNSLQSMDLGHMRGTLHEAARVLARGAWICVCVTHPIMDAASFSSDDETAACVIRGGYLNGEPFEDTVTRDGLTMTFRGWTHSLEEYFSILEEAGFLVEALREPKPSSAPPRYKRFERVPMFLNVRARKS